MTAAIGSAVTAREEAAPRRSVLIDVAGRYGMEAAAFEQTLRNTVVPASCTKEQFAAFLVDAREHDLNPLTKEIYAFPAKGGGITPIVGVDGWIKLANRQPEFDGIEFEDHFGADGKLLSVTSVVYRKDRSRPTRITEYMNECVRATDPWRQSPIRMLRHKALIQGVRVAFGFAGIMDEDDAYVANARDVTPMRPTRAQIAAPQETDTSADEADAANRQLDREAAAVINGTGTVEGDEIMETPEWAAAKASAHAAKPFDPKTGEVTEPAQATKPDAPKVSAATGWQPAILPPLRADGLWTAWQNDALEVLSNLPEQAFGEVREEMEKIGMPNVVHATLSNAMKDRAAKAAGGKR